MPSNTSLTPLPYPNPTDAPFVHLDIKALAEATTESLFVAAAAAPAHKVGRRWTRTTDGASFLSDGTRWFPADGRTLGGAILTAGSFADAAGTETTLTGLAVTFEADGVSNYEIEISASVQCSVANDRLGLRVKRGATVVMDSTFMIPFVGVANAVTTRGAEVPPAGTNTYQAVLLRAGGTGTMTVAPTASKPALLTVRRF